MQLSDLRLDTFMPYVIKVNRQLANEKEYFRLLDAAKKDTPIIDDLLREIAILSQSKPGPDTEKGLLIAQRDLTIFLALRAMQQEHLPSIMPSDEM